MSNFFACSLTQLFVDLVGPVEVLAKEIVNLVSQKPRLAEVAGQELGPTREPDAAKTALARLDDVARYLAHHRIEAGPRVMLERTGSGAEQLIEIAREERADLLVAAAYGHQPAWASGYSAA